jgi:uncharacterized protein YjbI with pentapeptide repeats
MDRKASAEHVETDRQRQKSLDDYLAQMTSMLLNNDSDQLSLNEAARKIARTRTLAVLRSLDAGRKAQVLQFLYEAGLVGEKPIVQLNGADFADADLDEAVLRGAELRGVHFGRASLVNATLDRADLRGSVFSKADFKGATLRDTNLSQANLTGARISPQALEAARTDDAILPRACWRWSRRS